MIKKNTLKATATFTIFVLWSIRMVAQTSEPKYPQNDFVLYQGGPSITLQSWGKEDVSNTLLCNTPWAEGGKAGGPGNLVATHHFGFSNFCLGQVTPTNSSLLSAMDPVNGYWQIPLFTSSAVIGTTIGCSFTMSEITRIHRGRWYQETLNMFWYTPVKCDSSVVKVHNIRIAEPIAFINTVSLTSVCSNRDRIDLRNYVNDPSGVFNSTAIEDLYFFNPSRAAAGSNVITYSKVYDNGAITRTLAINVFRAPIVNAGSDLSICQDYGRVNLADATPGGGTWSGQYVVANTFTTTNTPPGTYTLAYTVTDASNCTARDERNILINPLPVVNAGANLAVCANAGVQALTGATPAGGLWSGIGVEPAGFNPQLAGIGTHTITYTYADARSLCAASAQKTIQVYAVTPINAGADQQVCDNSGRLLLGGEPTGGTWSGAGVNGNTFDPLIAASGTHTLTYNLVNAQGCRSADTKIVTVFKAPVVTVSGTYTVCQNAAPFALTATPNGGTWSGSSAITSNVFDPKKETSNNVLLRYTYTDNNTCSDYEDVPVTILPKPLVLAPEQLTGCLNANSITLSGAQPSGGTWQGRGVSGNTFNTRANGVGTHQIIYTVQNSAGCRDTARTRIVVFADPAVNAGKDTSLCQSAADLSLNKLNIQPGGGTWSGPSVLNNVVKVTALPVGQSLLYYRVTDVNGCIGRDSIALLVNPVPTSPVITGKLQYCMGSAVQLQATVPGDAGAEIFWYHSPTAPSIVRGATYNRLADTSRTVFAEALNPAFNCASIKTSVQIIVENARSSVTVDKDTADFGGRVGYSVASPAGSRHEWTFTTGLPSGEKDPAMYFYQEGYVGYTLVITTPLGCIAQQTEPRSVFVRNRQLSVISNDPFQHSDLSFAAPWFSIYPNPTDQVLNLEVLNGSLESLAATFTIVNALGQVVMEGPLSGQMMVGQLPAGLYQLSLHSKKNRRVYSFQKL